MNKEFPKIHLKRIGVFSRESTLHLLYLKQFVKKQIISHPKYFFHSTNIVQSQHCYDKPYDKFAKLQIYS